MKATGIFLPLVLAAAPVNAGAARVHQVMIENMKFNPEVVEIEKGDTVMWINKDIVPHTATAEAPAGKKPLFDSGALLSNSSFRYKPKAAGEITYQCLYHPTMKGRLHIKK